MDRTCDRFWQDCPTFVTGATGFLGGWLVQRLLDLGADFVCLMRDWTPQSGLIRKAQMLNRFIAQAYAKTYGSPKVGSTYHSEAESGLRWNDAFLDIDWSVAQLYLSDKDAIWSNFKEFCSPFY